MPSFFDMKKAFLLFILLSGFFGYVLPFQGNLLIAQKVCNDTIYPLKLKGVITECCIEKVENENFVLYTKNGEHFGVEAKAIIKDGLYIPLISQDPHPSLKTQSVTPQVQKISPYKYDYEKYSSRFRTAKTIATIGGFVAVTGIAMTIGSAVSYNNGNMGYTEFETLVVIGFFAFNLGVPTSIIGLAMARNSKQAMITTRQKSLDLSFGITKNGVGLVLKL